MSAGNWQSGLRRSKAYLGMREEARVLILCATIAKVHSYIKINRRYRRSRMTLPVRLSGKCPGFKSSLLEAEETKIFLDESATPHRSPCTSNGPIPELKKKNNSTSDSDVFTVHFTLRSDRIAILQIDI